MIYWRKLKNKVEIIQNNINIMHIIFKNNNIKTLPNIYCKKISI